MNTRQLIENHQVCTEIIEGIEYFERAKRMARENINGFAGSFPNLRKRYLHDLDIYGMCVERLKLRYHKQMEQINKYL